MTISPRFQAAGRKHYNFPFRAASRRACNAKDCAMTHVVMESCIKCKYTDCVDVCPVDCFHEGPNMLVIDPDECIDCAVCIPECPVNAIVPEEDVPEEQKKFTALNAELAKIWPVITDAKPGPEDADQWKDVKDKLKLLEREARDAEACPRPVLRGTPRARRPCQARYGFPGPSRRRGIRAEAAARGRARGSRSRFESRIGADPRDRAAS